MTSSPPDPPSLCGVLSYNISHSESLQALHFIEAAEQFSLQARQKLAEGCVRLRLESASSLLQCRAALLGARGTGLPIDITIQLGMDGRTPADDCPLATLVTVQAMGAASFGFAEGSDPNAVSEQSDRLAPWAQIPFYPLPGQPAKTAAAVRLNEASIVTACSSDVFVLEEGFEYSEPLACELDMSEAILQVEDHSNDVLLVRIAHMDDAVHFSINAHMARLPVGFSSDNENALEMALALFNGCAVIDSISEIPRSVLQRLADEYGAHVV